MPLPAQTLGRQLEELVAHFVVPGETILWWSRPSFLVRAAGPLLYAFAILVLALLFAFTPDSSGFASASQLWTGVGYAVLCIVACFLVFVLENWNRQRYTLYLLTTHRAIAFEATSSRHFMVVECWPEDLSTLRAHWNRVEWTDGRDPNPVPRRGRLRGIWRANQVRRLMVETLRERLGERFDTPDERIQRYAMASIAAVSDAAWIPAELLHRAVSSPDPTIRYYAALALEKAGQWPPRPNDAIEIVPGAPVKMTPPA